MHDAILSSVQRAPTSRFVYSSLGFFGSRRGGALPGPWFVQALGSIGIEEGAIRQTLYRMEKRGALDVRREGRTNLYAASPPTAAIIEAGTDKMLAPGPGAWDGEWSLVQYQFDADQRQARDHVRDILMVEGFTALAPGLYVHPRDRAGRVRQAVEGLGLGRHLQTFRGRRDGPEPDDRFARERWDLSGIAGRYRRFLDRFEPVAKEAPDSIDALEAFGLRFALVIEYLEVAWDDPELPPALLPEGWPGARARRLVKELYETLLPLAVEHADRVLAEVGVPASSM